MDWRRRARDRLCDLLGDQSPSSPSTQDTLICVTELFLSVDHFSVQRIIRVCVSAKISHDRGETDPEKREMDARKCFKTGFKGLVIDRVCGVRGQEESQLCMCQLLSHV